MYYAIKELGTKNFITNTRNRNKTSAELSSAKPPRLFTTRGGATRALKHWKSGQQYVKYTGASFHEPESWDIEILPIPERVGKNLVVVEVSIFYSPITEKGKKNVPALKMAE